MTARTGPALGAVALATLTIAACDQLAPLDRPAFRADRIAACLEGANLPSAPSEYDLIDKNAFCGCVIDRFMEGASDRWLRSTPYEEGRAKQTEAQAQCLDQALSRVPAARLRDMP